MKEHSFTALSSKIPSVRRIRAVALVLVLSFLVIISGLVIAFFSMVTTEASSAGTAAAAASAKSLGDSAVSYVMGTIVDATAGRDPSVVDPTNPTSAPGGPANAWAWASQPGMIRTYDNTGAQRYIYKLYSADEMKVQSNSPIIATDTAGLSQWATGASRDVWTDLNEPGKDVNGYDVYPIVDPTADENYQEGNFPGHKDRNSGHKVAGFRVLNNAQDSNAPPYEKRNNNPAPMPVKWLYVLQDGTMCTAHTEGDHAVLNNSKATKDNPIKGRIAFWTDDECSKVNINTASQGTYWDTPRVYSPEDSGTLTRNVYDGGNPTAGAPGLAVTQPTKGEYQRFAGHPATTCLSPILGFMGSKSGSNPVLPVPAYNPGVQLNYSQEVSTIEKYYTLTPRILGGGSYGGTLIPTGTLPAFNSTPPQGPFWRLYASVDELLFNPVIPTGGDIHRIANVPNPSGNNFSVISQDTMQKAKFFLTANSTAPEVTLFNTPRVSMWPINDVTKTNPATGAVMRRTPFDELARFCATIGTSQGNSTATLNNSGFPFYFTRWNPRSSTDDFADPNNSKLYAYLRKLTSLPVPGNAKGGTFQQKFINQAGVKADGLEVKNDVDQILTCIYDYIRCINMQDATPDPVSGSGTPYLYTPIDAIGTDDDTPVAGAGEVLPIRINNSTVGGTGTTQGFGRFNTVGSAYLVFFAAHGLKYTGVQGTAPFPPGVKTIVPTPAGQGKGGVIPNIPEGGGQSGGSPVDGVADALGVVFMLSFNCPAQGHVGNHPKMAYQVENLHELSFQPGAFTDGNGVAKYNPPVWGPPGATAGGADPNHVLPINGVNIIDTSDVRTWHGRGIGGTASPVMGFSRALFGWRKLLDANGPKQCLAAGTLGNSTLMGGDKATEWNYPFYGYTNRIPVPNENNADSPSYDANKTLYWPTVFTLKQTPGKNIRVSLFATENINRGAGAGNGTPVQTIELFFPNGTFRMPYAVDSASNKGPNGGALFTAPVTGPLPPGFNQRYDYNGSIGGANRGFFFNSRLLADDGNAASGGKGGKTGSDFFILPEDTVVALEPAGISYMGRQPAQFGADLALDHTAGDQRMYAAMQYVPASYFQPDFLYGVAPNALDLMNPTAVPQFAHNMMREVGTHTGPRGEGLYQGVYGPTSQGSSNAPSPYSGKYNVGTYIRTAGLPSRFPDVPRRVGGAQNDGGYVARADGGPASWDTGMGLHKDGAYINKPDEGDQSYIRHDPTNFGAVNYRRPYVDKDDYFRPSGSFFSPNRQVPSSMMLGSIPTGIQNRKPWQTLLFHPPLKSDKASNPGSDGFPPADHYMADLFWIPVVEPYAISQPFSTAGKINMNYQIQPFTYIKRDTGMRAIMTSMKMMAIPTNTGSISTYKPFGPIGDDPTSPGSFNYQTRFPINLDATMTMFNRKFDVDHEIYRSATEVSTVMLVPQDQTILQLNGSETADQLLVKMDNYWSRGDAVSVFNDSSLHQLTGNNVRNKPYADMYGRLTTKSNVFTVHLRAQALRKAASTAPDQWVSGQDQVVAEYRGSSIIERYIDANDPYLPDFALRTVQNTSDSALNIDQYYKFRVVSTKRFSP